MRKAACLLMLIMATTIQAGVIPYKQVTITQMTAENPSSWNVISTHTSITGYIIDWRFPNAFDGDTHIIICDSPGYTATGTNSPPDLRHCIVAEITQYLYCPRVAPSSKAVTFYGQAHYDGEHHWWELHPLEKNSASACYVKGPPTGTQ